MVRAKFKATRKISHMTHVENPDKSPTAVRYIEKEVGTVEMTPVQGDDNKPWSVYTPSGKIEMTINNPSAYDQFKLGEEYFVDFTPAK
jgi:hypothetical protein